MSNYQHQYYLKRKEKILKRHKLWYARIKSNKDSIEWKNYRKRKTLAQAKYRKNNRDKILRDSRKGGKYFNKNKSTRRNRWLNLNGKNVRINKREYTGKCEICGIDKTFVKFDYHHWDDSNPAKGLWLCRKCHMVCEGVERNIHNKYLLLKENVENLFNIMNPAQGQGVQNA